MRRTDIGWSLKELADMAGITPEHLGLIERGLGSRHQQTLGRLNAILDFAEDALNDFEEAEAPGFQPRLH